MASPLPRTDNSHNLIIDLGRLRDGILVLISLQYLMGFLIWSVYALVESLGPLPPLDASYVVAGFVPTIFIILLLLFTRSLIRAPAFLDLWLNPHVRWKRVIRRAIPLLWIAIMVFGFYIGPTTASVYPTTPVLFLLLIYTSLYLAHRLGRPLADSGVPRDHQSTLGEYFTSAHAKLFPRAHTIDTSANHWSARLFHSAAAVLAVPFLGVYAGIAYALRAFPVKIYSLLASTSGKFLSAVSGFLIWVIAAMTFLGATEYFLLKVYPQIPQEWGGLRPKCAQLDLEPGKLSDATYTALVEDYSDEAKGIAVRTDRIAVLYFGGSFMAIRPARREGQTTRSIHAIRSNAVSAVIWCNE